MTHAASEWGPKVSVVLPVYNRRELVRRAIQSVLSQSYTDFELIVVDDNSSDGTGDIVQEYCEDSRIRLHRNETNLGPAGARNRGIDLARGRYIAFQDSDDRWFPEKLAMQVEATEDGEGHRACFCGALYFSPEQCYYIPESIGLGAHETASGDISRAVLFRNPTTPQTLLVERSLFDEVGRFDETLRINEDWDLAIRLSQVARFAFVPDPLVVIYRTANSVSSDRVADIAVREHLLETYADLYAAAPAALAHQHYVIGSLCLANRTYGPALRYLRSAFRKEPTLRRFGQIQRAHLRRLSGT